MMTTSGEGEAVMERWIELCRAFHEDEEAVAATEYVLLLVLIACVGMAITIQFGRTSQRKFFESGNAIGRNQDFGIVESN